MHLTEVLDLSGPAPVEVEIVSTGADYIRHTMTEGEVKEAGGGDALWLRGLAAEGRKEDTRSYRPVSMPGYTGYGIGAVSMLTGATGRLMMQVSGPAAHSYVGAHKLVGRVSRLDLQVTARPLRDTTTTLVRIYKNLVAANDAWAERGRAPGVRIVYDQAVTVYSGKRSRNGLMMRFYDAGAVHGEKVAAYVGCIRAECEITGARAQGMAEAMVDTGWDIWATMDAVVGEANHRGARLFSLATTGIRVPPVPAPTEGTTETTLRWLERQVRPAIRRLRSLGVKDARIAQALGVGTLALSAGDDD